MFLGVVKLKKQNKKRVYTTYITQYCFYIRHRRISVVERTRYYEKSNVYYYT